MPVTDRVCRLESPPRNAGGHRVERIAQPRHAHRREDDTDSGSERRIAVLGQYLAGPTGVGKSWLACALGHKACREGFSVLYRRAQRLFTELATARGEGRLSRLITTLERTRLLIIDDWGPEPLTAEQRRDLLEIVDDRYEKGSLLITSQVPISRWHELVGNPTLGDAILDRIVHRAHRIELKGPSLRKRHTVDGAAIGNESLTNAKDK
jgi:DNA replication protein DnaC